MNTQPYTPEGWDYNTNVFGVPGDNIGKYVKGKPFDIYDRYYLDDIYGIPTEYRGAQYLPEVTVTAPKKKALGGPLVDNANIFAKGGILKIGL